MTILPPRRTQFPASPKRLTVPLKKPPSSGQAILSMAGLLACGSALSRPAFPVCTSGIGWTLAHRLQLRGQPRLGLNSHRVPFSSPNGEPSMLISLCRLDGLSSGATRVLKLDSLLRLHALFLVGMLDSAHVTDQIGQIDQFERRVATGDDRMKPPAALGQALQHII